METVKERKIIVVVDDAVILAIAQSTFSEDLEVVTAPSVEGLFFLLENLLPTLILIDIDIPDKNGFQVITMLKSKERTEHIPVIFLSAKTGPKFEVAGLDLGAVDFITKPFSREQLIERINQYIHLEKQKEELHVHNLSFVSEAE
jgi:putative two-component system response regulator